MSDEMRADGHEPATKADLREFATKADLRDFATKADLRDFATKADLRDFATKADLHATQAELRNIGLNHGANLRRLNIGFARLEGEMVEVKETLKTAADNIAALSTHVERMSSRIETALRKMDMQASMLMDHEGRITKLEPRPS